MKRYLIFAGYDYYPNGGAEDFEKDVDTKEEIKDAIILIQNGEYNSLSNPDWFNIIDIKLGKIIKHDEIEDMFPELFEQSH